ncbi:hypothetical protein [Pusillimonas sp. ANT_WB101]|uniref:hypothetical protein n=1 Tax=Pusillimonas sp. ANT_WB101 TaxID=2597356 RepID=UPI0011EC1FDA|nr:hypothetical protein [Pusillimonas sp. ANT_WB101]KAA0910410.1 hypothetical protein FQ179_00450 [Pusillimonas sp. ANT_WB101]
MPARERFGVESFDTGRYLTEACIAPSSKAIGMALYETETEQKGTDAQVISLVCNEVRLTAPHTANALRNGDIVLIEANPEALASALDSLSLMFGKGKPKDKDEETEADERGA